VLGVSLFAAAMGLATTVAAGEKEIRAALAKAVPGLEITRVAPSEIKGMFLVESNNQQELYVNDDASFMIAGELYGIGEGKLANVSEKRKDGLRRQKMAEIRDDDRIVFPAVGETKAKVAVFTDIDCGYCRKLHNEVPRLNELGVEVSYLAYPRSGVGKSSYKKYVSAWCAKDRQQALTDAKSGKEIKTAECANPVADQFELGQQLGISGTPAIILQDGTLIPGYIEADRLAQGLGIL
jgi:thiol:disulfide interchange protein DsbC